jgi:hypothetical protein
MTCVLDAGRLGNYAVEVLGFWRGSVGKCGVFAFRPLDAFKHQEIVKSDGFLVFSLRVKGSCI